MGNEVTSVGECDTILTPTRGREGETQKKVDPSLPFIFPCTTLCEVGAERLTAQGDSPMAQYKLICVDDEPTWLQASITDENGAHVTTWPVDGTRTGLHETVFAAVTAVQQFRSSRKMAQKELRASTNVLAEGES